MKVKFNFNLDAWVEGVEIEADSLEEAKEKLRGMTAEELLEEGFIKESDITDVDADVLEEIVDVKVFDIEYDYEPDDFDNNDFFSLPTEMTFTLTVEAQDSIEELIADEVYDKTGYLAKDFRYTILAKR